MVRRDPVTPVIYLAVVERDQGCVAVRLGEDPGDCRGRLEVDHVDGLEGWDDAGHPRSATS